MQPCKLKVFSDISYFALNQMEAAASDDERRNEVTEEVKEREEGVGDSNDEFSTYFTDQKVEIPDDDRVRGKSETLAGSGN
jgi:hypothetical protein